MAQREVGGSLEADQEIFFQLAREGFRRAAEAVGVVEQSYRIAGFHIRLRFAGPALAQALHPALAHNSDRGGEAPDFTIELFDSVSTDTPLPLLLRDLVEMLKLQWWGRLDTRREIKDYHGERIKSVFHLGPNILSVLDTKKDRAVYWVHDASQLPYYEKGSPLSTLLNWWLSKNGRIYVHAAAFGNENGGVLLTGKGGSGKSTTSLSCVDSPLCIVGDDYCVLDPGKQSVHSLYNTIKLKGLDDVERFPSFKPMVSNLDRVGRGEDPEKAMLFLHQHLPGKLVCELPVKAVLVPSITGRPETAFAPCSAAAALKAIAPNTLFQLAGNDKQAFRALARVVSSLPTYHILLGTRLREIPLAIQGFLAQCEQVR